MKNENPRSEQKGPLLKLLFPAFLSLVALLNPPPTPRPKIFCNNSNAERKEKIKI